MRIRLQCNAAGDLRVRLLPGEEVKRSEVAGGAPYLVCSAELQELTTRTPKGARAGHGKTPKQTTFTRHARQVIREAGGLLDQIDRQRVVFLTGTVPGSTPSALKAVSDYSGWIVEATLQWVRDFADEARVFGVWEWQKRGALHMHVCVACKSPQAARVLKHRWRQRWLNILDTVCVKSKTDVYAREQGGTWQVNKSKVRVDAQIVEKSVACYLSKYLSKGSQDNRQQARYYPSRWWFMSKTLRRQVSQARLKVQLDSLSLATAQDLFERIGAAVAERTSKTFGIFSQFDTRFRGITALLKPIEASLLFDYLKTTLQMLQAPAKQVDPSAPLSFDAIALMFGASRKIAPAAP